MKKVKKLTLTVELNNKTGMLEMNCENDGFNALELIGIFEKKKQDIYNQMECPTNFVRSYIDKDGNKVIVEDKEVD